MISYDEFDSVSDFIREHRLVRANFSRHEVSIEVHSKVTSGQIETLSRLMESHPTKKASYDLNTINERNGKPRYKLDGNKTGADMIDALFEFYDVREQVAV